MVEAVCPPTIPAVVAQREKIKVLSGNVQDRLELFMIIAAHADLDVRVNFFHGLCNLKPAGGIVSRVRAAVPVLVTDFPIFHVIALGHVGILHPGGGVPDIGLGGYAAARLRFERHDHVRYAVTLFDVIHISVKIQERMPRGVLNISLINHQVPPAIVVCAVQDDRVGFLVGRRGEKMPVGFLPAGIAKPTHAHLPHGLLQGNGAIFTVIIMVADIVEIDAYGILFMHAQRIAGIDDKLADRFLCWQPGRRHLVGPGGTDIIIYFRFHCVDVGRPGRYAGVRVLRRSRVGVAAALSYPGQPATAITAIKRARRHTPEHIVTSHVRLTDRRRPAQADRAPAGPRHCQPGRRCRRLCKDRW